MDKRENTASHVLARFRGFIQAAATLITNIHLPNFAKGGIYQGAGKTVCVPGLNCYSCPAASGACPIGSFQSVVGSSKFNFSYYVTGTLILLGVLLGRFVCGFLCPFGWLQELLHKIPGKKLSTKKAQGAYVYQIRCAAICRGIAACAVGQRFGDGRSVLLQVHLSTGCARGRHSSGHCQCRHSICVGTALYLETCRSHCRGSAERFVLPPLLQMDLSTRRILCAHE